MVVEMRDLITVIATLFGTGGAGYAVVKAAVDWRSGRVESEKDYHRRMLREARENDLRADLEVANRFAWQEYASVLRRMLIELGVETSDLPKEPVNRTFKSFDDE